MHIAPRALRFEPCGRYTSEERQTSGLACGCRGAWGASEDQDQNRILALPVTLRVSARISKLCGEVAEHG